MPALKAFLAQAHYGILDSTIPPHTAAAWTTWLTGKDPGQHGIVDFVKFDPTRHRFRFHDSTVQRDSSIFQLLSKAGISCGSIFLPRNYPPYPLKDGYIVSGFETPNVNSHFTEPVDLRDEVLNLAPDMHFNFEDDWEKDVDDAATFARNIERIPSDPSICSKNCRSICSARARHESRSLISKRPTSSSTKPGFGAMRSKAPRNRCAARMIKKFFRRVDGAVNHHPGITRFRFAQRRQQKPNRRSCA